MPVKKPFERVYQDTVMLNTCVACNVPSTCPKAFRLIEALLLFRPIHHVPFLLGIFGEGIIPGGQTFSNYHI